MHIETAGHHERKTYNDGPAGFGNAANNTNNNTSDYTTGGMRNTLRKKNRTNGANSTLATNDGASTVGTDAHV
jgi:hypothetical protein